MTGEIHASGNFRTMAASEFQDKCLKLMDEVADSGEEIVVTKNGRPMVRLVAYSERPKTLLGIDRGKLEITGDIISPIDVEWEAATGAGWWPDDPVTR